MKKYKDNHFDLAIVDPPYGIGADKKRADTGKNKHIKQKDYHFGNWDKNTPKKEYFEELFRVSKNQIIWGGNYFVSKIPYDSSCWIVWDKDNGSNSYADCEIAYTSFSSAIRKIKFRWFGFLQENMKEKELRIHPTQKPIQLYKWLLYNYSEKGQKILDTHLGSGSIAVACHYFGVDLVGVEIDKEYYNNAKKRIEMLTAQETLF